jgi:hypothetical protein
MLSTGLHFASESTPAPYGPTDDDMDAASIAARVIDFACRMANSVAISEGDAIALVALEAVAMLAAFGRADLGSVLNALATTAPRRAELLAFCNNRGLEPPPLAVTRFALAAGACRAN